MAADSADLVVVGELRSANFHSAKHSAEVFKAFSMNYKLSNTTAST